MSRLAQHIPSYLPAWRRIKDQLATGAITAGGGSVLLTILLIFVYLLYEVLPLFNNAHLEPLESYSWKQDSPLYLAMEEQGEVGLSVAADGKAYFFDIDSGEVRDVLSLTGSDTITAVAPMSVDSRVVAIGTSAGAVRLFEHKYRLTYPAGERLITPTIERRYADITLNLGDTAVDKLAVSDGEDALVVAAQLDTGEVVLQRYLKEVDFLTDDVVFEREALQIPRANAATAALYIGTDQRWLYQLGEDGSYRIFDLRNVAGRQPLMVDDGRLFQTPGRLASSEMLLGGISLLAASDQGELLQLFMAGNGSDQKLATVRSFNTSNAVLQHLVPEHRRKGFLGIGANGQLQIFHSTAHRSLLSTSVTDGVSIAQVAISPRGNKLIILGEDGTVQPWSIDNEHPDISWSALWQKVWYESYDEPEYIWQSSASNNDFEPKYSFSPLAFGTLKAAFYTMLIAAPLGICGAIYTAYFMAPSLRGKVKPLIELMEALPTVILGFLAGLWLAPFVENQLTGIFALLIIMPIGVLLFAFMWSRLPVSLSGRVADGWHAALLIPVVLVLGYISFAGSDVLELWLFGGDMRVWITNELGISFDQRNALIVGIAMGMAVIPTIFSITEDAIFSVPKHLSYGSLALGATPWQTLVGVVLPTASPGIFSALMIGMGRAVGETMIVLMATGNTPIMDANIFEGMRTLAANIAVEVPEAEVDSTHYRVLFLAAFVLFLFTFVVNTAAELVRQRLRIKYGSL
ncbi:MAG: ABC transporter permease subunit [Halioglobus sp.]